MLPVWLNKKYFTFVLLDQTEQSWSREVSQTCQKVKKRTCFGQWIYYLNQPGDGWERREERQEKLGGGIEFYCGTF